MNNTLSVLILNRNNSDDVISIYEDLKKQTFQDFHVIIIDDNSDNGELQKLKAVKDQKFIVYSYPKPWKFGNDNKWSMGLKKAYAKGSKYTYSIQTDMKINDQNLLEKLVEHLDKNPQCGAASPTIYDSSGGMTWGPGIEKIRMGKTYNINETFITRNSLMNEMNYIPENLIYYGCEFYFNNWLKLNGYKTEAIPGVSITHYGGGTSSHYWNQKYYYRPRTTILIMKLFNKQDTLTKKIRYFRSECWEIETKLREYYQNRDYFNFFRLFYIFTKGTLVGLFLFPKVNN